MARIREDKLSLPSAKAKPTVTAIDPYYLRDPITGLSPAQVEANKAVAEAAAATGMKVTPGATGPRATSARVSTTPIVTATQIGTQIGTQPPAGDATDINAILAEFYKKIQDDAAANRRAAGESAYNLLYEQFSQYGLGSLVEPLRGFIEEGLSPAEFTIRLRGTDAYKKRFAANAQRVGKGLRALSEAEYIDLEDQYQNIMRNYGLPESYYTRGELGRQEGFEKFIAGDVSAAELEDRISTAYNRVTNANPEIAAALRDFYPDITNGDILAYALNPDKALTEIKRKVTAAEIGGAARQFGLGTSATRAEELAKYGVTKQAAQEGFQTIGTILPRGGFLAEVYKTGPYTQATAEAEVFGTPGAVEAARQRKKLSELEQAQFAGSSGMAQGALARDRAGAI